MDPYLIKTRLYAKCVEYINQRIENAESAMKAAQESANEETKSSAGDKYETGRAMAQLERDKNAAQLGEAQKLKQIISTINPESVSKYAEPGALVHTSSGEFYLAISLGKIVMDSQDYYVISPASPIGQLILSRKPGDYFSFNGKNLLIKDIF